MRLLTNRDIKILLWRVLLLTAGFTLLAAGLIALRPETAVLSTAICGLCMGGLIVAAGCLYFQKQNRTMQEAVLQIRQAVLGNQDARIDCDEEGELYRLFHEVNSLAAILNAHAAQEETAKQALKATISDISHQLKTPLAALAIYNGIVQEEAKELPTVLEFIARSEQELDRIELLVQSLLKIAKLDAGTIVLEPATEDISELLGCIRQQFACRAAQEGKTLDVCGGDGIVLECDRNWWMEAIGNIVKNAFDNTQRGDVIHIRWSAFASVVQVVVQDSGCGIHPEDLHHIFKRFYRSRFSKDTQGIGLGLPLAKSIIEAHGGTIEVDSALGRGTTFTVNFLIPTTL